MRIYKRTYGLRQICNIAVYMLHCALTVHLLNLPDKVAKRDIIHGVKHLEEIAEDWLCARRTLSILSVLARKWKIELPDEASVVFARTDSKFGTFSTADVPSPKTELVVQTPSSAAASPPQVHQVPQPISPQFDTARVQNPLQQSLHSYLPDVAQVMTESISTQLSQSYQTPYTPSHTPQLSNGPGTFNAPLNPAPVSKTHSRPPFGPTPTISKNSASSYLDSGSMADTPVSTRQVSPSTLFGGVEALVESQDWWLRDQANLAIGFDNWDLTGTNMMNGSANDLDLLNGMVPELYMSAPTRGSDFLEDDSWTGMPIYK